MTHLEFILKLLDILAWPCVVLIALLCFRVPLRALMSMATRLKIHDVELEFGRKLVQAKEKAVDAFETSETDIKSSLLRSAANYPNSAVLEAWKKLDSATEAVIRAHDPKITIDMDNRYKAMEEILTEDEIIDTKRIKLFSELRQLRNKIAHAQKFEVSSLEAIQYIELCFSLIESFDSDKPAPIKSFEQAL